jgi:hypothetical protein
MSVLTVLSLLAHMDVSTGNRDYVYFFVISDTCLVEKYKNYILPLLYIGQYGLSDGSFKA